VRMVPSSRYDVIRDINFFPIATLSFLVSERDDLVTITRTEIVPCKNQIPSDAFSARFSEKRIRLRCIPLDRELSLDPAIQIPREQSF